jgi:hypothetical protein
MRIKVIACEVLFREVCLCAARSPHVIDLEFLPRGLHDNPETLRAQVQQAIDAVPCHSEGATRPKNLEGGDKILRCAQDDIAPDAIALGYGLCSNGTLGLVARDTPLVIPRAHDCITFFLGSKDAYDRHFHDEPGTYYYTSGWIERAGGGVPRTREEGEGLQIPYDELVAKYGEDNAQYLYEISQSWIKNYARAAFIGLGLGPQEQLRAEALRVAQERSWDFTDLPGDLRLLRKLTDGEWDGAEFLIVQPGQTVIRGDEQGILAAEGGESVSHR